MDSEEAVPDYQNGGILNPGVSRYRNTHPWKGEVFLPLHATPEQVRAAALIQAFQDEIDLIDTSALGELP
ncbi:hypothetical protein [Streptomyces rubiginosohelvolus]|uniref:hypothetical protein n=1 Tax=Streptomyces rubiginosohelvolus TaxID=67362 RepID=UPI0036674E0B